MYPSWAGANVYFRDHSGNLACELAMKAMIEQIEQPNDRYLQRSELITIVAEEIRMVN